MNKPVLSYNSRKALAVQLGESAGTEIANLIQQMAKQIENCNVTRSALRGSLRRVTRTIRLPNHGMWVN